MLQDGWSAVQMACWHDSMKALGALLKWNPDLGLQDSVRFNTVLVLISAHRLMPLRAPCASLAIHDVAVSSSSNLALCSKRLLE